MRRRVVITLVLGALAPVTGRAARADRFEASLAGAAHGGVARVGETGASTTSVPTIGATARATYAWRNALAWDLQLGAALTQPATFADAEMDVNGRPERGAVTRRTITTAAQLGAELRLGARTVPTLRLGLGPQLRYRTASDLGSFPDAVPAALGVDAVVSVGLGIDLRLDRHRVIGVALQLDHAQPLGDAPALDVIALNVRVAHFWYPRWGAPSW
ncbi:MAG: hypothetical protein IPL61_09455 [Myxococcales bacterium]|nr:hypothetical protein [Myxococcales bacterium]